MKYFSYFVTFVDLLPLVLAIFFYFQIVRDVEQTLKKSSPRMKCRQPTSVGLHVDNTLNNFIDKIRQFWRTQHTLQTLADDVEVMAIQISPSITVNTMLWLTNMTLYCSSKFITVFFKLLYSFFNNWCSFFCYLVCFFLKLYQDGKTLPHRKHRIVPKNKFISRCFCRIQLSEEPQMW